MDPAMMQRGWTCYSVLARNAKSYGDACFALQFAERFGMGQVPVVRMLVYVGNPSREVR